MRLVWSLIGVTVASLGWFAYDQVDRRPGNSRVGLSPPVDAARPIAASDAYWIEELTWMEVRDAIASGHRTVLIPVGGIEQNGPYVVTGKHNVILKGTSQAIAERLGNALIAPIVAFVPQGEIEPPSGHMRYPGTISVSEHSFRSLLHDIVLSLKAHGFNEIILIGDSGGNQDGMAAIASELDGNGARVFHVTEYYDWDERANWLAAQGFDEVDEGIHDELSVELIMLAVDPDAVRINARIEAGRFAINGIPLEPVDEMRRVGWRLIAHIADKTVAAIHRRRAGK
ncbi:creatininase family protein [Qipengyuania sp.]|uniref:creatininase family protein n=1 Tax=Qipengyuania sp. TaxID=2004515 RepID=UPI003BAC506C